MLVFEIFTFADQSRIALQIIWLPVHINYLLKQHLHSKGIHLIQKRLSSELLHCALRIVAYPDRKTPLM